MSSHTRHSKILDFLDGELCLPVLEVAVSLPCSDISLFFLFSLLTLHSALRSYNIILVTELSLRSFPAQLWRRNVVLSCEHSQSDEAGGESEGLAGDSVLDGRYADCRG